ncbi:MAG: EAL domain-containing protein [Gammaproteobacteria bacterium]|nr:EAL domain-containing protein [Gammaproteobacteria bacterium]MDP2142393.1 EAL domain-containing protein [Gammaproteobacteria bacterium]MDP2348634.1 EAL domain-containing protein [Gammaproteobacteria bacterium]
MIRSRVLGQLLVILLMSASLFIGFYLFILQGYEDIEQETLELNRRRVLNALDLEVERLDEVIRGWAAGGLIHFLISAGPTAVSYRDALADAISGSFNIRNLAVIDQDGELIIARETDPSDVNMDVPQTADSPFVSTVILSNLHVHEDTSSFKRGLMMIDGVIHLISAHPNLDFEGNSGMTSLIAAVQYNQAAVANLAQIVEQEIEILPLAEFVADGRNQAVLEAIQESPRGALFQPVNGELVEIYSLINDYSGKPSFVMKVSTPRDFYSEASRTLMYSGIGGGLVFILLVGWFLLFLDKSVLRRLETLSAAVDDVGDSRLQRRLPVSGNDEIGAFGRAFNGMLDSLQSSQHALLHQATHDALTGLINRHQFELELDKAIVGVHSEKRSHHLLFIDLDRFKIVNDSCGHMAGDKVLVQIAELMRAQLRSTDVLGRIGGDEFGVILLDCDPVIARELAGNLREAVAGFRFQSGGRQFTFGASVGLVNLSFPEASTRASALTLADSACAVAKNSGRNRTHEHSGDDKQLSRQLQQTLWVSRITEALESSGFVLFFQCISSVASDLCISGDHVDVVQNDDVQCQGVEILLRLKDSDDTMILPDAFLPAAERYRLTGQIDRWVIRHFFRWFSANRHKLDGIDFFALNLSAMSLADSELFDFISAEMRSRNIPGDRIFFEITELSVIENLTYTGRLIKALKGLGCRFALDDFGAGMSSFAYLRNLPVDVLKINGDLCRSMQASAIDKAMVKSINEIGHLMNLKTVAEHVDNAETLALCRELGIDYVQGRHWHRPEPLDKLAWGTSE